jgi:hypothetical protein
MPKGPMERRLWRRHRRDQLLGNQRPGAMRAASSTLWRQAVARIQILTLVAIQRAGSRHPELMHVALASKYERFEAGQHHLDRHVFPMGRAWAGRAKSRATWPS